MTAAIVDGTRATEISFTDDAIVVTLLDGRIISVPLIWYPRLDRATDAERRKFEWIGGGIGIHWPDLDEDLSVAGFLLGVKAPADRQRGKSQ